MLSANEASRLLDEPVSGIAVKAGGAVNEVYEVRRPGAASAILKVYRHDWSAAKERHVYALLRELDLPVPDVLAHSARWTLMTELPGELMSSTTLDDTTTARLFEEMGRVLARIHTVELPAFGYLTGAGVSSPQRTNEEYMSRQFEQKLGEFVALGGDRATHDLVGGRVEADRRFLANAATPVLCHNDLHTANLLVEGGRIVGIVDVENAVSGDPMLDLGKTIAYAVRDEHRWRASLLTGYGELPADAEERIRLYLMYHALELWVWFAQIDAVEDRSVLADDLRRLATE